ncbi:hypothetical protein V8C34DRAFT_285915 [Trichoderma compactum]
MLQLQLAMALCVCYYQGVLLSSLFNHSMSVFYRLYFCCGQHMHSAPVDACILLRRKKRLFISWFHTIKIQYNLLLA